MDSGLRRAGLSFGSALRAHNIQIRGFCVFLIKHPQVLKQDGSEASVYLRLSRLHLVGGHKVASFQLQHLYDGHFTIFSGKGSSNWLPIAKDKASIT